MFEREIEESIEIAAGPSEIWWQLTNFDSYYEWNPFITRIDGELREGARLSVTLNLQPTPEITIRPKVIVVDLQRQLRWRGQMGLPNLFDGEHIFTLETTGVNRVCFTQRERFSGLLAAGGVALIERNLRRSFREMNEALRQRAEAAHATREVARAERDERK
jgi:hypothetical protein